MQLNYNTESIKGSAPLLILPQVFIMNVLIAHVNGTRRGGLP